MRPNFGEPRCSNIGEPMRSDFGEPMRSNFGDPRCSNIGEPMCPWASQCCIGDRRSDHLKFFRLAARDP